MPKSANWSVKRVRRIHRSPRFPVLATIILLAGVVWLFNDLDIINFDVPWIPVIVIIIAVGMIYNRFNPR